MCTSTEAEKNRFCCIMLLWRQLTFSLSFTGSRNLNSRSLTQESEMLSNRTMELPVKRGRSDVYNISRMITPQSDRFVSTIPNVIEIISEREVTHDYYRSTGPSCLKESLLEFHLNRVSGRAPSSHAPHGVDTESLITQVQPGQWFIYIYIYIYIYI